MAIAALRRTDDVDVERLVRRGTTALAAPKRRRRKRSSHEPEEQPERPSGWERIRDFFQSLKIYVTQSRIVRFCIDYSQFFFVMFFK